LFSIILQPDSGGQGTPANPYIRQPAFASDLDTKEQVGARGSIVTRPIQANAGTQRSNVEAERFEDVQKETILLKAVPAAPVFHQLTEDCLNFKIDPPPKENVEVLKGNRMSVSRREGMQHGQCRLARTGVPDPSKVSVKVCAG
jgi:hypothetical protein